ncbi:MAG: hypothetical protein DDT22_01122 [candidate division WS2 bacterium]|nr:hypothetical protein [Candidatus Lithacetigena glycinireducens]
MKGLFKGILVVALLLQVCYAFAMIDAIIPKSGIRGVYGSDQIMEMDPPLIGKVTISPKEPKANEDVQVVAEIANDVARSDAETTEAYLLYSTDDGKTWTEVEMEQDGAQNWKGAIPAQPAGTKVMFYVRGIDDTGNMATEMPGINTVWPPTKDAKPLLCEPFSDPDTETKFLPDDMDITDLSIGYDDKSIYGALKVQGKISKGTMSPTWMQVYAIPIINPDKGEDLDKLMDAGVILVRSELIVGAFGGLIGLTKPDFVIDKRIVGPDMKSPGKPVDDKESGLSVVIEEGVLYFKVNRNFSALKDNKSGRLKMVALSGAATATDMSAFAGGGGIGGGNITRFLNVYLRSNSYTVK